MAKKIDPYKKIAGLLIPVFALRRPSDLGIGDTKCVLEAIDFFSRHKLKVFQVLPINETAPDNSPYNAISSIALDPVYITLSPDMVPGLTASMLSDHVSDHLRASLGEGPVQYSVVKDVKLKILFDAFVNFDKAKSKGSADFTAFLTKEKDWIE